MLDSAQSSAKSSATPVDETESQAAANERSNGLENPATVKALQIVVIVLGVILVLGFVTVIGRIAYLVTRPTPQVQDQIASTAPAVPLDGGLSDVGSENAGLAAKLGSPVSLGLEPGAQVEAMTLDGDRLAVAVSRPAAGGSGDNRQRNVIVVDIRTGRVIARIELGGSSAGP